jgi:hypothetical protein
MMSDPHQAMRIAWMQTWQMQAMQIACMQRRCEAMPVDMGWPDAFNVEGEVYEYARTQAMQIAWMQGRCEAMTDDMSWPHAFNVEGEVNENAGQDGFLDLQVYREVPAAQAWGRHVKARWVDEYRRKDGNTEVRSRLVTVAPEAREDPPVTRCGCMLHGSQCRDRARPWSEPPRCGDCTETYTTSSGTTYCTCDCFGCEFPDENKRQDGFLDIDIAAELLRLASWGLSSVQKATCLAECLQLQLASVSHTLTYLMNMPAHYHQHPGWDDLELRAARALIEVDTLLQNQTVRTAPPLPPAAVDELKLLQRHAQDIAVMACSRFINQATLQSRRIPTELLSRLQAVFTYTELQNDDLWARLGNSKYHVFTEGSHFGERKHRHGRGGRKSRSTVIRLTEYQASSAASSDVVAGGGPAAVVSLSLADLAQPPVRSLAASSWEFWELAGLLPTPPTGRDWATHLEGLERLDEPTEALRIQLLERTTKEAMESYYVMGTFSL